MDQVTSELALEHIAGSPELNSIHHDRERELLHNLSRSALTCSDTPEGPKRFLYPDAVSKTKQSYECRTSLRFTTTCPDKYANARHTITYMECGVT